MRNRNQNNPEDDSGRQMSQSDKKSVQFKYNNSTRTGHPSAVTHSGDTMHLILKLNPNLAISTNSVSTIVKETDLSWMQKQNKVKSMTCPWTVRQSWIFSIQMWIMILILVVMSSLMWMNDLKTYLPLNIYCIYHKNIPE